jgi:hypothetical protein
LLGTAQTFSAAQTFSVNLTSPGTNPAADSTTAIRLFKADGTTAVLTVDTTNSRVITAGDVFPFADTAGVFGRNVNQYQTPTDHFTAFSGWTWQTDAGVFAGAPNSVDVVSYPSWVGFWNQNVTTSKHFAAQTVSGTSCNCWARMQTNVSASTAYAGLRIDDGTNTNYVEARLGVGTGGVGYRKLVMAVMLGGTETLTTIFDNLPNATYTIRIRRSSNGLQLYYHHDFVPILCATTPDATWNNPTRAGLIGFNIDDANRAAFFDWVRITA